MMTSMVPKKPDDLLDAMEQSIAFGINGDRRQRHLALIYRAHNSKVMLLHLGWHHRLAHEEWNCEYHWMELSGLDLELQETFADWAVQVAGASPGSPIPYSVYFRPCSNFDSEGRFIQREDGSGLTCATFVLALFGDFNLPLIDVDSWPVSRPGDFAWVRRILGLLRRRSRMEKWLWLEQVRRRHALKRFRPEEVFATAGVFEGIPLLFPQVEREGRRVVALLSD